MTGQESQTLCQALAEAIREASLAGNLVGRDALLADFESSAACWALTNQTSRTWKPFWLRRWPPTRTWPP